MLEDAIMGPTDRRSAHPSACQTVLHVGRRCVCKAATDDEARYLRSSVMLSLSFAQDRTSQQTPLPGCRSVDGEMPQPILVSGTGLVLPGNRQP
jgi:hypothetical protein